MIDSQKSTVAEVVFVLTEKERDQPKDLAVRDVGRCAECRRSER
jgi:hypothetical protein